MRSWPPCSEEGIFIEVWNYVRMVSASYLQRHITLLAGNWIFLQCSVAPLSAFFIFVDNRLEMKQTDCNKRLPYLKILSNENRGRSLMSGIIYAKGVPDRDHGFEENATWFNNAPWRDIKPLTVQLIITVYSAMVLCKILHVGGIVDEDKTNQLIPQMACTSALIRRCL